MSLYLKHRPKTLSEIVGNREIVTTLKGLLKDKSKLPHTFLFHGSSGCGKTTLARIVATELGCTEQNIVEIDTAQFRGIDTVRDVRKNAYFTPLGGGVRVYIIDEVHKMTGDAQNAFLKILEDTPSHIYFILCTTDPQSLLATIRGRCSAFQVHTLSDDEMILLLTGITEKENETLQEEVIEQIVKSGLGQPRDSIQILEQVLATPAKRRLNMAQQANVVQTESIALCRALIGGKKWLEVSEILQGLKKQEPESIRRVVIGYCSSVLLNKENDKAAFILEQFLEPFYDSGFPQLVYACYAVTKN